MRSTDCLNQEKCVCDCWKCDFSKFQNVFLAVKSKLIFPNAVSKNLEQSEFQFGLTKYESAIGDGHRCLIWRYGFWEEVLYKFKINRKMHISSKRVLPGVPYIPDVQGWETLEGAAFATLSFPLQLGSAADVHWGKFGNLNYTPFRLQAHLDLF